MFIISINSSHAKIRAVTMDRPPSQGRYEPLPRHGHGAVKFGDKVYLWGGKDKSWGTYPAADIEIFDICTGLWEKKTCNGIPPPGTVYSGYTRIGGIVYSFGGWKDDARYNSLHQLDLSNLMWEELEQNNSTDGPSGREGCGMVSLGLEMLVIFGGSTGDSQYTNDLHLYSVLEGEGHFPVQIYTCWHTLHRFKISPLLRVLTDQVHEHWAFMLCGADQFHLQ